MKCVIDETEFAQMKHRIHELFVANNALETEIARLEVENRNLKLEIEDLKIKNFESELEKWDREEIDKIQESISKHYIHKGDTL